ncbi:hypothetical protein HDU93_007720 [Gonapodya sp. JEL0774]|nr:hypothetical protein HDU93_007720 [Gonapodya sp. JEL0774]
MGKVASFLFLAVDAAGLARRFGLTISDYLPPIMNNYTEAGYKPRLIHTYYDMVAGQDPQALAEKFLQDLAGIPSNGIAMISLQPFLGIGAVTEDIMQTYAQAMALVNQWGYKVICAFAHEMNGAWYPWGRQPSAYREMFQNFSRIVKATAPATAMAWLPTVSNSYPFDQRRLPEINSTDWNLLDTNNNSQLDAGDDPYEPFWVNFAETVYYLTRYFRSGTDVGDDAVDWVGGTIYYYGPSYPYINNFIAPQDFIASALDGYRGTDAFYSRYCGTRNKSLVWAETSIFHWPNGTGADILSQKQSWWRYMLGRSMRQRYPKMQALAWFEIVKVEETWGNQTIDFAISSNATVMNAFLRAFTTDLMSPQENSDAVNSIVVGVGALGVVYGSSLHQPESSPQSLVSTVLRSEYEAVVAKGGFTIRSIGQNGASNREWKPHKMFRDSAEASNSGIIWDYVIVCSKCLPDQYSTADLCAPLITAGRTTVILVQNGLGVEREIALRFPRTPVAAASAYISAARSELEPGVTIVKVNQGLPVGLYRGEDIVSGPSYSLPQGAEEKVQRVVQLWNKGGILAGCLDTHELLANPGMRAVFVAHQEELERAAEAVLGKRRFEEQVKRTAYYRTAMERIAEFQRLPAMYFSLCNDFKLGYNIELECILGEPVRQAKSRGYDCPRLETTYELLKSAAERRTKKPNTSGGKAAL